MPNFEDGISCLSVFAIKISPKYFKYFMKTSLGNSPSRPDTSCLMKHSRLVIDTRNAMKGFLGFAEGKIIKA
jgi:hypothetical protein